MVPSSQYNISPQLVTSPQKMRFDELMRLIVRERYSRKQISHYKSVTDLEIFRETVMPGDEVLAESSVTPIQQKKSSPELMSSVDRLNAELECLKNRQSAPLSPDFGLSNQCLLAQASCCLAHHRAWLLSKAK